MVADLALPFLVPAAVVASAAAGDVDALATIVGTHHDDMARIAYLITRDGDLAQACNGPSEASVTILADGSALNTSGTGGGGEKVLDPGLPTHPTRRSPR